MKITDISATRCGVLVTAISMTLFLSLLPSSTDARKPQLLDTKIMRGKTATGFHYMTGGLAFDEQRTMERQSAPYNLKLVFARSSLFVSPVLVWIGDNQGLRVEKIRVRAPWFYIRLPSGGYTIVARIKNKVVLIRDVYLRKNRRATYFVR